MYQIKIDGNEELFNKVEEVLLSSGYSWYSKFAQNASKSGCIVINENEMFLDWNLAVHFGKHNYTNLTQKQFFEIFDHKELEMSSKRGVIHVNGNEDLFLALQNLFLSKKFKWEYSDNNKNKELCSISGSTKAAKEHYFYFNLETKNMGGIIDPKKHKIYTLDEIFSLFIFKPITVKLNNQYSAVINKDNVEVGCQTFTHEKIDELHAASLKARGEL